MSGYEGRKGWRSVSGYGMYSTVQYNTVLYYCCKYCIVSLLLLGVCYCTLMFYQLFRGTSIINVYGGLEAGGLAAG